MKKFFVASDIHGFFDEWQTALTEAGFDVNNKNHIIVVCGDLLDRGSKPYECMEFLMKLPPDRRILIRGNHEDLMEEAIKRREFLSHDIHNGTCDSAYDIINYEADHGNGNPILSSDEVCEKMENHALYKSYINATVDYYETQHYVFVHGWIPCRVKQSFGGPSQYAYTTDGDWRTGNWESARWYCGMKAWHDGVKIEHKTIVCGHWHASFGNSLYHKDGSEFNRPWGKFPEKDIPNFKPFEDKGIIALDSCTVISHMVNVKVIEDEDIV